MPSKQSFLNAGYKLDDLIPFAIKRNGCSYRWAIPLKDWEVTAEFNDSVSFDYMRSKGAVLWNILVPNIAKINFPTSTSGVKTLDVHLWSSETEDRQLLHKLSSDIRAKENRLDKDSLPGTNNNDE